MIDEYILGICLRCRCHVFLKLLPNFASRPENKNIWSLLRLLEEKTLFSRTCLSVRTVTGALTIREKKKQQEITQ